MSVTHRAGPVILVGQRYYTRRGPHRGERVEIVVARTRSVTFRRLGVGDKSKERHSEKAEVFLLHHDLIG